MNDDDRLTPEERNLIDAALAWTDEKKGFRFPLGSQLVEAADAYRDATAPPEPFECLAFCWPGGEITLSIGGVAPTADAVYRCTVTPIERVR